MIDQIISTKLSLLQTPFLNNLMIFITNIADKITLSIFSIILIILLLKNKKYIKTKIFIISMALGVILSQILEFTIKRPRPISEILIETGYSFPSGHTTMATIFFGMLICLFAKEIKNKKIKIIFISLNILLITLISFSRIYLNVHYLTDIIGGIILGLICILIPFLLKKKISYLQKNKLI